MNKFKSAIGKAAKLLDRGLGVDYDGIYPMAAMRRIGFQDRGVFQRVSRSLELHRHL